MPKLAVAKSHVEAMSDLLRIKPHHLRSIQIARDFTDPASSENYVVTPFIATTFQRISQGLRTCSTTRAWRLTGDYGSGKSSFSLAFARHASGATALLPTLLQREVRDVRLEPVLVVGAREPLAASIARALHETARRVFSRVPNALTRALTASADDGRKALVAVEALTNAVRDTGKADGIILVLDELGKNLEHAASSGEQGDVHLLQDLAEAGARSGDTPIVVLALVHQAITAYARDLPAAARREWEKVSGRYEEVVFAPPIEQAAVLVASALDVRRSGLPRELRVELAARMSAAVRMGWYGVGAPDAELSELALGLAPLDPMVLPVLTRLLRRFGQNERSLFSFLSSTEPHGLLSHARSALDGFQPYGLPDLYDYVAANLAGVLAAGPAATRWGIVDAVVRSAPVRSELERAVLKTIGIVNLLDDPALVLTREAACLALAGTSQAERDATATAMARLADGARLIYDRGIGNGLCLWPHTSVDLEEAFEMALAAVASKVDLIGEIRAAVPAQPLVARRHYVETGTLRHFEVSYCGTADLPDLMPLEVDTARADGRVIIVLCERERERASILERIPEYLGWVPTLFVGVPEPVGPLAPMLRDVRAWRWISESVPALAGDRIARDEVSRQTAAAEDRLRRALDTLLDLRGGGALTTRWFHMGVPLNVRTGRQLATVLSDVCSDAYRCSPLIQNELINRRLLSSAAARARSVVIEALAQNPGEPMLGLDGTRAPPEVAIYLSVFRAGGLHVLADGGWRVAEPSPDPLRLKPSLDRIAEVLTRDEDRRVPFEELARELRVRPYGLRDGVIPLVVAIYLAINWHRTAVYEDGTYLEQVGAPEFTRMLKEPEFFTIQHCAVEGVRAEVFARLAMVVGVAGDTTRIDLLDVVRPLLRFVARLPDHARRTRDLSVKAAAVRSVLLRVQDPAALVFIDLPRACGLPPFSASSTLDDGALDAFVADVARAVKELANSYPALVERICEAVGHAMDAPGTLEGMQATLSRRAEKLLPCVVEHELRAFALRLADRGLTGKAWIEAIASFLARKPPERWAEADEREFHHRLKVLSRRYKRVQATADDSAASLEAEPGRVAFRLVVTSADGRELEELVQGAAEDEQARELEARFRALLASTGRVGLLAAARALIEVGAVEDADGMDGEQQ